LGSRVRHARARLRGGVGGAARGLAFSPWDESSPSRRSRSAVRYEWSTGSPRPGRARPTLRMLSRFSRRTEAAAFVTMALTGAVLLLLVTVGSLRLVGRTFPGFLVWDDLVVSALGRPQWTGVEAQVPVRSVVTTVDGQQVNDRAALMR